MELLNKSNNILMLVICSSFMGLMLIMYIKNPSSSISLNNKLSSSISSLSSYEKTKQYTYDFIYNSIEESNSGKKSKQGVPNAIFSSLSGKIALASDTKGNIYRTTNYGKTWSSSKEIEISNKKYGSISGCVMSHTSEEILVSTNDDDTIFYSNDYGKTFTIQSSRTCSIMAASSDLQNVICINGTPEEKNSMLHSTDKGVSWTKSKAAKADWIGVVANSDFSNIVAVVQSSRTYAYGSTDD